MSEGGHAKMGVCKPEKRRYWEEQIRRWGACGVSQVEFCRVNDINLKSFRYWKRRIEKPDSTPALVELPLAKASWMSGSSYPNLCLIVDRYRIEIGKGFDPVDLESVVRILRRI